MLNFYWKFLKIKNIYFKKYCCHQKYDFRIVHMQTIPQVLADLKNLSRGESTILSKLEVFKKISKVAIFCTMIFRCCNLVVKGKVQCDTRSFSTVKPRFYGFYSYFGTLQDFLTVRIFFEHFPIFRGPIPEKSRNTVTLRKFDF